MTRKRLLPGVWGKRRQSGAATVEYIVVAGVVIVVLVGGTDVMHQLWQAMQKIYSAFYYAISMAF
jgi:Flp pilus assembly pilin Flp